MSRSLMAALALVAILTGCGALAWLSEPAWDAPAPTPVPQEVPAPGEPEVALPAPTAPPTSPAARIPSRGEVITSVGGVVTGNPLVWGLAGQLVMVFGSLAKRRRAGQ